MFMGDDSHLLVAISWLICGAAVAFFIFMKLGAGKLITKGDAINESIIQRTQMEAAEVDLATIDAQLQDPAESRAPASKFDTPE